MTAAVVALLALTLAVVSSSSAAEWARVQLEDPIAAQWLKVALDGAAPRLAEERCQGLLEVYSDEAGRPLRDRLAGIDTAPQDYLTLVLWRNGSRHPRCDSRAVTAWTVQSSRVVFVCEQNFLRLWAADRKTAEATLVHEALHTLGLGEAPAAGQPTQREITQEVLARCF